MAIRASFMIWLLGDPELRRVTKTRRSEVRFRGANRNRRLGYFVTIRRGGPLGVCSAGESTNVSHTFQPSGRFWFSNSL